MVDFQLCLDVSRHNTDETAAGRKVNWKKPHIFDVRLIAMRATVGKYYKDPTFQKNYDAVVKNGYLPAAYHASNPVDSWRDQVHNFFTVIDNREVMPVLDVELPRSGGNPDVITEVNRSIVNSIADHFGRLPALYNRQSWWDKNTRALVLWSKCKLWSARYIGSKGPFKKTPADEFAGYKFSSPWSDNHFKYRDWDDWAFWQWSADNPPNMRGTAFGFLSSSIDLSWFNGTLEDLTALYNGSDPLPPAPVKDRIGDLEKRVTILETLVSDLGPKK